MATTSVRRSMGLVVLLAGLVWLDTGHAQSRPDALRVERLAQLGRLWATVTYFHPYLAYRDIDWDGALITAIAELDAGTDDAGFRTIVTRMLHILDDPVTRIVDVPSSPSGPVTTGPPVSRWTDEQVLVVKLNDETIGNDLMQAIRTLDRLRTEIGEARGLLFDLRTRSPVQLELVFANSGLTAALTAAPMAVPGLRMRMHMGYAPERGRTSGAYYSGFYTRAGRRLTPGPDPAGVPVVFLINDRSRLPGVALALQSAGRAAILSEGDSSNAAFVGIVVLALEEDLLVRVRLGEVVYADGTGGFRPDLQVDASDGAPDQGQDPALARGLALLRDFEVAPPLRSPLPAAAPAPVSYPEGAYPSREYRVLAALRVWAVITYFFPYRDLMDDEWDEVLRTHLPQVEQAEDARAYHLAIARMYTNIRDQHGAIRSTVLAEYFGTSPPPIYVRWIEGAPVVAGFLDEGAAREAGIELGDVVLEVDGEDAVDRIDRYAPYVAYSRREALLDRTAYRALRGADGTTATLTLRDGAGRTKTVRVPRRRSYSQGFTYRTGPVIRMLEGNIGYADLDRLTSAQVPEMFERFMDTDAIIFDMRGYPNGTAWTIAPYLATRPGIRAARFDRPHLLSPRDAERQSYTFLQPIPPPGPQVRPYAGRTVMVIDERTISQAEHTGLFFEAANDTVFVGSHTAGANGDVTNFAIPGGISLTFTGQSVRHADGRQLQRVGLVPHREVKPTIAGIRAGEDEVLEAALEYLRSELNTQP